ncbi:MAG: hypothetical protein JO328_17505 [Hyphomicrobiales bacterium]|nr:hypothetical protein [Hyphomicrobiales bacterium]MBV9426503.1 hypothetical protein [Bradyrhizobiaceae bacterium]
MATKPEPDLRVLGLIHEAQMFVQGLRMIALGFLVMEFKHGSGVTACANEIEKRLEAIKARLQR